jgi:hypothetical protein
MISQPVNQFGVGCRVGSRPRSEIAQPRFGLDREYPGDRRGWCGKLLPAPGLIPGPCRAARQEVTIVPGECPPWSLARRRRIQAHEERCRTAGVVTRSRRKVPAPADQHIGVEAKLIHTHSQTHAGKCDASWENTTCSLIRANGAPEPVAGAVTERTMSRSLPSGSNRPGRGSYPRRGWRRRLEQNQLPYVYGDSVDFQVDARVPRDGP